MFIQLKCIVLRRIYANTGRKTHILTERNFGKFDGLSLIELFF